MTAEFVKDLENSTLTVNREFNADLSLVWRAWTEPDLLCQWWAPRPWRCETISMDFRPGGKWVYVMVGPEGERHGGLQVYSEILHEVHFKGNDAFADEQGNINENLPVAIWENTFTPTENGTLVKTVAKYPNPEALQVVLNMGMEEGLKMAQAQLDALLSDLK